MKLRTYDAHIDHHCAALWDSFFSVVDALRFALGRTGTWVWLGSISMSVILLVFSCILEIECRCVEVGLQQLGDLWPNAKAMPVGNHDQPACHTCHATNA